MQAFALNFEMLVHASSAVGISELPNFSGMLTNRALAKHKRK